MARSASWTTGKSFVASSNKGISPRMKLGLQVGFAALLFCLWLIVDPAGYALPPLRFTLWVCHVAARAFCSGLPRSLCVLQSLKVMPLTLTDGAGWIGWSGTVAIALFRLWRAIDCSHPRQTSNAVLCRMSQWWLSWVSWYTTVTRPEVFMGDTGST